MLRKCVCVGVCAGVYVCVLTSLLGWHAAKKLKVLKNICAKRLHKHMNHISIICNPHPLLNMYTY